MIRSKKLVSSFSTQENLHDILITHLKLDHNIVKKNVKIEENNFIDKIPIRKVIQNCNTIKNTNINIEKMDYLMQCLTLEPIIMKNRIFILKELGINSIELSHIYRFPTLMRKKVNTFKKINNIPVTENIMKNIFSNVGIKIDNNVIKDFTKFEKNMKIGNYYQICMSYYKTFYLKLYDQTFLKNNKIKYRSFKEMFKLIYVLKNKFNFDEKFIIKNSYLLNIDVDNVEKMITDFKYIKIKEKTLFDLINIYPRILLHDINEVKELIELYKTLDIPYQFSYFCVKCLSVKKKKFLERYNDFQNNVELAIWLKHPRFLQLIYYYKLVKKRLYYMKYLNCIDHANIQIYLSSKEIFLRFIEGEYDLKSKKKHLLFIFRKEFGKDINLISVIQKHPYWKYVSLLIIIKSIQYLKKHYSIEDICQNIHIILYPRSKIDYTLNLLYKKYSQEEYNSTHYLSLCLYELEKNYYFSGDGIWPNEVSVFKSSIFEDSFNFNNFIEYIDNNDNKIKDLTGKAWLEYLLR
ncbi:hypothetical protein APICC_02886 [Apis cerana cerana]|uniref:mTERF domain-containing protein n=1 Tax=Apis cerana cerana TaxID=94128 RepID=A0A2A3EES5_APICC|nr:hypothetical protein APICC_02886 [Apis cerana cerana]